MSNNFLISLRNDSGGGTPGLKVGDAAYIEMRADDQTYNLNSKLDLQKWLGDITGTSVLVFVHGFGNDAEKVVARHKAVKPHLPPGVSLVSFDWPSGNPGLTSYKDDKANAKQSAPQLMRDCIQVLLTKFASAHINLFAHSMGAYVTENAFFHVPNPDAPKINHVMFAAADVDQQNYKAGSLPLTNFLNRCTDLTAYWSIDDKALQESEKMDINKGAVPLGLQGYPDPAIPANCYSMECTGYYETFVEGITPIEPGAEMSHVWYLLYEAPAPSVNDFQADLAEIVRLPWQTRAATTDPNGFLLQRPKDA
jgi:pimeloyl-ACP methyl ester carboxylesterase